MNKAFRRALAATIGGALAVTAGTSVPAPAMAATAPHQVMLVGSVNYPYTNTYQTDMPSFAGQTGLLRRTNDSWFWTRYADGGSVAVEELGSTGASGVVGLFGDTVELRGSTPAHTTSATVRWTLDLATMTWHEIDLPFNWTPNNVRQVGESMVLIGPDKQVTLRRPAADGSYTTTPVTGVPEGAEAVQIAGGDGKAAVIRFGTPSAVYGLLDAATGHVAMIPGSGTVAGKVALSNDRIGLYTAPTLRTFSRQGIAEGSDTEATTVTLQNGYFGLAGDDVIVAPPSSSITVMLARLHPDGTTEELARARSTYLFQAPDGVHFIGADSEGWAVHKATGTEDHVVVQLSDQVNAGVTLERGYLRQITALERLDAEPEYHLYGYQLTPGTGVAGNEGGIVSGILHQPVPCETAATCVRAVDGARNGVASLTTRFNRSLSLFTGTTGDSGVIARLPSTGGTVVDASWNYHVVNGTGPAQQYIVQYGGSVISTRAVTGAGLWFDTLWTATAGRVQPQNLRSGAVGTAVATGSSCTASDVQATAKHVLWACGASGPAGVHDLARKTSRVLPAGQYLLGDNYAVRHDADGTLVRVDLTDGSTATVATFPRGTLADDRNITWAVDKYSGNIAWVDDRDSVHIVDPGVARSTPAAAYVDVSEPISFPGNYSFYAPLTRPVDNATLTVT
ncbi:hypothetical protein Ade02nite_63760 [Paractinoplanes deccanensis]|uniref:Uncharacterized protein n=1 Tax=Paractinoplanes deccanensis TaxID=113561 RepID=A0ABQ3YCK7_9ACTN|nr:hypothetical protein [Actinoplanes deccanensis]GID77735.1 hypothetical protein Ade02nite_63760 [Actinoplanes deccanensis]